MSKSIPASKASRHPAPFAIKPRRTMLACSHCRKWKIRCITTEHPQYILARAAPSGEWIVNTVFTSAPFGPNQMCNDPAYYAHAYHDFSYHQDDGYYLRNDDYVLEAAPSQPHISDQRTSPVPYDEMAFFGDGGYG
ncbi:hypothetical protein B0H17DRAFT_1148687 [Mycena rosella]|uniref:Uncharacterized protein n=1 Tax=Mycena rosella TaxID=1033263 RepID=A0AAD7FTU8_MYCRO|nr:hypothetical protein B0H17DRAFT_1148687 [Mycena rosella]